MPYSASSPSGTPTAATSSQFWCVAGLICIHPLNPLHVLVTPKAYYASHTSPRPKGVLVLQRVEASLQGSELVLVTAGRTFRLSAVPGDTSCSAKKEKKNLKDLHLFTCLRLSFVGLVLLFARFLLN